MCKVTLTTKQIPVRVRDYSGFRLNEETAGKMPTLPEANALITLLFTHMKSAVKTIVKLSSLDDHYLVEYVDDFLEFILPLRALKALTSILH